LDLLLLLGAGDLDRDRLVVVVVVFRRGVGGPCVVLRMEGGAASASASDGWKSVTRSRIFFGRCRRRGWFDR